MTTIATQPPPLPQAEQRPSQPGRQLSGQVVGQLGPGEQLVLWALRQRQRDGGGSSSATLIHGFRLAFGLAQVEAGLAAFEALFAALPPAGYARAGLLPLRCACLSAGERAAIALVASAQAGEGAWLELMAARLAPAETAPALARAALAFARALRRAGLALPPLTADVPGARSAAVLH